MRTTSSDVSVLEQLSSYPCLPISPSLPNYPVFSDILHASSLPFIDQLKYNICLVLNKTHPDTCLIKHVGILLKVTFCFLYFLFPGIDYYNKIIDDLLRNGVTPIVAIYHFDLPQALEDQGGWLSEGIVEAFDKYAQFCFRTFGDRVKQWLTINEPNILALLAYDMGIFAPGVPHFGTGGYQAAHNLIKAHARSWHSYDSLFRKEQKGFVSLSLFFCWLEPAEPNSVLDQEATKRAINFQLDLFAKPIFIDGDYPELVKSQIASMSEKQGYPSSRLPEFTEEEKKMIKGTADFFAVQYYTTRLVRHQENKKGELSFLQDVEIEFFPNPSWENVGWIYVVPWGIRKLLKYIKVNE